MTRGFHIWNARTREHARLISLEMVCRDQGNRTVPAIIDTGFNGQLSLPRRLVNELDLVLTYEGTVDVEWADGRVIEEDIYSGTIRFDGGQLISELIITDAEDALIGTSLFAGKVLPVNFATRELVLQDHSRGT